jgi:hypothetical protein
MWRFRISAACDAHTNVNSPLIILDHGAMCGTVASSRSSRASPETSQSRSGMRRPASLFMQTDAREATGRHRPSATTSGTCERTNVRPKSTAPLCNARRSHQGGLGANKSPRWSAERRASPGCADGESLLRGDARRRAKARSRASLVRYDACGPASRAREGCLASTRAPVGAPLPSHGVREIDKARRSHGLARRIRRALEPLGRHSGTRASLAGPESIRRSRGYGFRARELAARAPE